jgi:microcin C transport system substrate-binding protein
VEDRDKALELLKAGEIDLLPIYTAQIWIQKTNFPQVQKNWIVRQEIYNKEPIGFQGFALNLRRPLFQDPRVRQALTLLLDRQLMNDKLMFNQYFLQNSYYPDLYPNNVNPAVPALKFDADKARALLAEAGWTPGPNGILQKDGQPFAFTILDFDTTELRHLNIYLQALQSVGISAKIEIISLSSFTKRMDTHDFDVCPLNWGAVRLRDPEAIFSSKTADQTASQNIPGVKDTEIDRLIELQKTEMDSGKRDDILRQIDARLVAIEPYILMWNKDKHDLLYWNKFGTPKDVLDKYDKEDSALVYWWYDPAKEAALSQAEKTNTALPPVPAKVIYSGE